MNLENTRQPSGRGPLPPIFFLVAILLMLAVHFPLPLAQLVRWTLWRWVAGGAFVAAGAALNVWADAHFKRVGTTVKPFERSAVLVTSGPFALSRNPMYVGMVLILMGLAMGLGSLSPWVVIPLFVWQISTRFIQVEERMLEETFGTQYREYRAKVRRWL